MILESIVTTINQDGSTNVSPMGPVILSMQEGMISEFQLRPFDTSRTYANLKRTREGVLRVDDNVLLFASAAIGQRDSAPATFEAEKVVGQVLKSACRASEFRVKFIDDTGPRMSLNCEVVHTHRLRDFFGFNRAKHAVLEAAILATRLDFLAPQLVTESIERLETMVDKAMAAGFDKHIVKPIAPGKLQELLGDHYG